MSDVARRALCDVIAAQKPDIVQDPKKLERLLRDECPRFPLQIQLLLRALRAGLVGDIYLLPLGERDWPSLSGPLVAKLAESLAIPERDARWAVESWAVALGKYEEPPPVSVAELAKRLANEPRPPPAELVPRKDAPVRDVARQALCDVIAAYGPDVCQDAKRCERLLHEECPRFPLQAQLLLKALRAGVVDQLRPLPDAADGWPELSPPLVAALAERLTIPERNARWAVESWAVALGKYVQPPPVSIAELVQRRAAEPPLRPEPEPALSTEPPPWKKAEPPGGSQPRVVWLTLVVAAAGGAGGLVPGAQLAVLKGLTAVSGVGMFAGFIGGAIGGAAGWMFGGGSSWTYLLYRATTVGILGFSSVLAFGMARQAAAVALAREHLPLTFLFALVGALAGGLIGSVIGDKLSRSTS